MATPLVQTAVPHGQGPEGLADDVALTVRRPTDVHDRLRVMGDGSILQGAGTGEPVAATLLSAGAVSTLTFADGANIVLNTTTGTKIATGTTQKLGFFNATPIVQPTAATTSVQDVTAAAATQTGSYVQADAQTVATLANALQAKYNALQADFAALRTAVHNLGLIA